MIPDKLWTWRLIIMSTSKQKPTWEKRSTPFSFRRCAGGDGWQELLQWNETDRATMNFANKEGNVLVPNLKKTQFLFIHTKAERTRGIGNFNWEWRDKTHLSKSYKSPSRGFYGGLDLLSSRIWKFGRLPLSFYPSPVWWASWGGLNTHLLPPGKKMSQVDKDHA